MKSKNPLKSTFSQTASYLILSILPVINTSILVKADVGNSSQAKILAQLSNTDSSNTEDKEQVQLTQTANTLLSQGNLNGAEENLRNLVKKFPDDTFGYYQLGNVLFSEGKKEDAIQQYQQAIHLDSKYALAHNAIGQVLASQEKWPEAVAEYQKALSINADYGEALTNMAQALWAQGDHQQAIASLEKALNVFKAQDRPEKAQQVQQILKKIKAGNDPGLS